MIISAFCALIKKVGKCSLCQIRLSELVQYVVYFIKNIIINLRCTYFVYLYFFYDL